MEHPIINNLMCIKEFVMDVSFVFTNL